MKLGSLGDLLLVGMGGFLGSILRYVIGGLVHRVFTSGAFPYGTLTVNVVGCLVIGFLAGLADSRQMIGPELRLFLFIGVLGGFTTFSTFGYETLAMLRDVELIKGALSVFLHLFLGLSSVWIGYAVACAR